jgi:hypothetical protein
VADEVFSPGIKAFSCFLVAAGVMASGLYDSFSLQITAFD